MTNYQPGDIVLVAFPYTEGTRARTRPALIILDTGNDDTVVARVTTQMYRTPHDVSISDWQGSGLLAPSVVRLHKLATLEKVLVRRRLGHLQTADQQRVSALMQRTYGTW